MSKAKEYPENEVVGKEACPQCRENGEDTSGDNLIRYSDGGAHCFACKYHEWGDGGGAVEVKLKQSNKDWKPLVGQKIGLPHRKISEAICRLYDYRTAKVNGKRAEVACYYDKGELVGQKVRLPNKDFRAKGSMKSPPLFGQHLWRSGGRRVVVTEGEIDCLAVAQMLNGKWPVVSVPSGAAGAEASFKKHSEWLNSYDEVVICFDMDKAGQEAALDCAGVLRPGKAKIATLPRKDAADMIKHNESRQLSTALWEAKVYRPDGILHASDVISRPRASQEVWPFPWRQMTRELLGQRSGEITMYTSGTGMGKSTLIRELAYHHLDTLNNNVGMIMLEESCEETLDDMVSLKLSQPVRQIMAARQLNDALEAQGHDRIDFDVIDNLDDEAYKKHKIELCQRGLYLYDHRGCNVAEDIIPKIEYMAISLGCKVVILDHISAVIATMDSGNERQEIDYLMGELRSLVERTGIHLMLVTQLRKADGKAYEEGGRITSQDLRGSGSLSSVPNTILAVERNQQSTDPMHRTTSIVRALKGRLNGRTGIVSALRFSPETGRLMEVDYYLDDEGNVVFDPCESALVDETGDKIDEPEVEPAHRSEDGDEGDDEDLF